MNMQSDIPLEERAFIAHMGNEHPHFIDGGKVMHLFKNHPSFAGWHDGYLAREPRTEKDFAEADGRFYPGMPTGDYVKAMAEAESNRSIGIGSRSFRNYINYVCAYTKANFVALADSSHVLEMMVIAPEIDVADLLYRTQDSSY